MRERDPVRYCDFFNKVGVGCVYFAITYWHSLRCRICTVCWTSRQSMHRSDSSFAGILDEKFVKPKMRRAPGCMAWRGGAATIDRRRNFSDSWGLGKHGTPGLYLAMLVPKQPRLHSYLRFHVGLPSTTFVLSRSLWLHPGEESSPYILRRVVSILVFYDLPLLTAPGCHRYSGA